MTLYCFLATSEERNRRVVSGAAAEADARGQLFLHAQPVEHGDFVARMVPGDGVIIGRNEEGFYHFPPGVRVVATNLPTRGIPHVLCDVEAAGNLACDHFHKQGLSALATYVNLNPRLPEHTALSQAAVKAATARGWPSFAFQNGPRVMPRWTLDLHLDDLEAWLLSLPMPIGVLCSDLLHAQRLQYVASRAGVDIPRDLALLYDGIDLDSPAGMSSQLSGIDPDYEGLGREAVRLLLEGRTMRKTIPPKGDRVRDSSDRRFLQHPIVLRAVREQERSIASRCSVEDLCERLGVSKSHLNQAFRKATGQSVANYLRVCRLELAVRMLQKGNQRVSDVAAAVGFVSLPHFSREIRQHTGHSPRWFLKSK